MFYSRYHVTFISFVTKLNYSSRSCSDLYYYFARRCIAGRSFYDGCGAFTGSRDLLQWAVGLQQLHRRRLFVEKAELAV